MIFLNPHNYQVSSEDSKTAVFYWSRRDWFQLRRLVGRDITEPV